jgi:RNA polymerase sigma-70 factor (ECF subfamily)
MSEHELQSRLSRISTIWTLLAGADSEQSARVQSSQLALIQRYQGAVYRYLLGATHDPDVADELFQEFALRFLKGGFRRVDPDRGRFRDYLRTTLVHLVVDHQKQRWKRAQPLDSAVPQPVASPDGPVDAERQFVQSWRDDLLARTWTALAEAERQGGQPFFSVLHFRVENPNANSAEMAARLTEQLQLAQPLTETGVRKTLQRARLQFADLLIDEVAHSLGQHTLEELEHELIELELLSYCRSALSRHRGPEP